MNFCLFRTRYITVVQQSVDNGATARQQLLAIMKFYYASVIYNSDEIAKDFNLMVEFSTFSQSFIPEISRLYMFVVLTQILLFSHKFYDFFLKPLIKGKVKIKNFMSCIIKLMKNLRQAIGWFTEHWCNLYMKF